MPTATEPIGDIIAIVARAHERDRYLASLLAPAADQRDLMTIAAFAGEVGRIPASVSEPVIGQIRLQWWRDALAATDVSDTGHPIADAARKLLRRRGLTPRHLLAFIDAQENLLQTEPPADERALTAHLLDTEGALFDLALSVAAPDCDMADRAALLEAAAMASGLTRMLIELPALTSEQRTLLPTARLAAHAVTCAALYAGRPEAGLRDLLVDYRRDARRQLAAARRLLRPLPHRARLPFLPLALVEPYLRVLERRSHDPVRDLADILPLSRIARLWIGYRTGIV